MEFKEEGVLSGFDSYIEKSRYHLAKGLRSTLIKCVPLLYLLFDLKRTHIDYFSLDTEGSELSILKTIPFDKIRIDVLSVEWFIYRGSKNESEEKRNNIISFMNKTNLYNQIVETNPLDLFFYRKDLPKW